MLDHLIQYLRHSLPSTDDELATLGEGSSSSARTSR